jgi:polymorphic membrane protein
MRRIRVLIIVLASLAGVGLIVGVLAGALFTSGTSAAKFGNPNGNFPVAAAGTAVSTSSPNEVIGTGTPATCTSAAVVAAVAAGGIITFDCGPNPVTILMTATATVANTEHLVVLDGGGLVTLSGGGQQRILFSDTCAGTLTTNDCVSQPYPQIVVQNITFENGYDGTQESTCTGPASCWYGGISGGGAIYTEGGQFKAVNSSFVNNQCYGDDPDLGGGAIRALAQYQNLPVYITSDTFTGNTCSNGGALSSIDVQWDILNSLFTNNAAIGWGANPAQAGTPGGGNGGAIYNDGENYDTLVAGTVMSDNTAREGGGAIFFVVNRGWGALGINKSQLANNTSGVFQNYPGVFDNIDGHDLQPELVQSTATSADDPPVVGG